MSDETHRLEKEIKDLKEEVAELQEWKKGVMPILKDISQWVDALNRFGISKLDQFARSTGAPAPTPAVHFQQNLCRHLAGG